MTFLPRSTLEPRNAPKGSSRRPKAYSFAHRERVTELAAYHRFPAMYPYAIQVVEPGGLMAYDANYPDLQTRAATYVTGF
jgi:hypothetical protein